MEKQQLELLIKENSELKEQMELLNSKVRCKSILEEIEDLTDGDYSTEVEWDCPLSFEVSFIEKDEDIVNYFNLYNTSNKINDTKKMNIKSFNFNDNNVKRKINPNNFVVNQTYINIDLPDFHKEKPERKCSNIYKLLFITTLTLLILINISFYIHISI